MSVSASILDLLNIRGHSSFEGNSFLTEVIVMLFQKALAKETVIFLIKDLFYNY